MCVVRERGATVALVALPRVVLSRVSDLLRSCPVYICVCEVRASGAHLSRCGLRCPVDVAVTGCLLYVFAVVTTGDKVIALCGV